jgi:murein DD-endopeptidase MepM/ murein hydrolase activator NlpD
MEFSRVTSGFTQARFHPILQEWRAHKGVDYAAPIGTPVRSVAEGKVLFAGQQNGYGNVIHIQHQGVYSTLYAHLSGFGPGIQTGARISQGQLIGFVGQTGWATGPHLHYEFRVNNDQRDPETLALPHGDPLTPAQKVLFAESMASARTQLQLAETMPTLVAGGD